MEYITDFDTPTLLLDWRKLERNIQFSKEIANKHGVAYRPHIKTHKSVDIANMQLEAGAVGLTVAKKGEAEVMVEHGFKDILIAYPIASTKKIHAIKSLTEQARIIVAVDSEEQAICLNEQFTKEKPLEVWIKVNAGLNRCGVEPKEEVLALASEVVKMPGLQLTGLFTHAGHAYGAGSTSELEAIAAEEVASIVESAELCEENGIQITHRSVGSTPTFSYYKEMDGITEIRPGNAAFYDMVQVGLGVAEREQCALTVQATVVSVKKDRIVIDAGSKTLALDKGAHGNDSIAGHGFIKEYPELVIERLSEEHGVIPTTTKQDIKIGERLTIIPNHACVVANLFDTYLLHEQGKVINQWPVSARGRLD